MAQSSPIQIGGKSASATRPKLLLTVVDKFFFVGIFAGIVGSAWLGARLWLMLNGKLAMSAQYNSLRHFHAIVQIHLFLGLFILGFSFHALPRIMGGGVKTPKWAPIFIGLPIVGILLEYFVPTAGIGLELVFLSFFVPALFVLRLCYSSSLHNALVFGIPTGLGLIVMAFGALASTSNKTTELFVLWFGVGPIIFATSQQFISGFLKGKKLSLTMSVVHICLYMLSGIFAFLSVHSSQSPVVLFQAFAATNIIITLLHYGLTRCYRGLLSPLNPINFTFGIAFLWSFIANVWLLGGVELSDHALHILALGWALTLVIGTSTNIISFMSVKPVLAPRVLLALLVVWQIVPIERGFPGLLPFLGQGPWIVTLIVVLILGVWGCAMLLGITQLVKKQIEALRQ